MEQTPMEIIKKIEKCIYHESDFNKEGVIYACALNSCICKLINEHFCEDYKEST